jgi:hypothetical protein
VVLLEESPCQKPGLSCRCGCAEWGTGCVLAPGALAGSSGWLGRDLPLEDYQQLCVGGIGVVCHVEAKGHAAASDGCEGRGGQAGG